MLRKLLLCIVLVLTLAGLQARPLAAYEILHMRSLGKVNMASNAVLDAFLTNVFSAEMTAHGGQPLTSTQMADFLAANAGQIRGCYVPPPMSSCTPSTPLTPGCNSFNGGGCD